MSNKNIFWLSALGVLLFSLSKGAYVAIAAKPGALIPTTREAQYIQQIIDKVWRRFNYTPLITSGMDGVHSASTKHRDGLALDFRTHDIPPSDLMKMIASLRTELGTNYFVLLEVQGAANEHLHVEYRPIL